MNGLPVRLRGLAASDEAFVLSSWLKSYRDGALVRHIPNTIYYDNHHELVKGLLKNGTTMVACDPEAPDILYGYINFEVSVSNELLIHYVYIKHSFRKMGVMTAMLREIVDKESPTAMYGTHMVSGMLHWAKKHGVIYNPYILFGDRYATR